MSSVLILVCSTVLSFQAPPDDRSGPGEKEVKASFQNTTKDTVAVFWVNQEGEEQEFGTIEAGETMEAQTFDTHLFRFKVNGQVVGKFRAGTEDLQRYLVRVGQRVPPKGQPKPQPKPAPGRPDPAPPGAPEPVEDPRGGSGSALSATEVNEMVAFHNKVRGDVGVEPVKWSPEVAKFAQAWADELARTGKFEHRPREGEWTQKYGENIAVGFGGNYKTLSGAQGWYGEIQFYAAGQPIPQDFGSFKAGHYTQMVWRKTTEIGAGKAIIQTGEMKGWLVLVCNYNPPGNYTGEAPY